MIPARFEGVDALRMLAHLWTFFFHFSVWGSLRMEMDSAVFASWQAHEYGTWRQAGHLATDMLFGLSGFLLVASDRPGAVVRRLVARLLRLYIPFVHVVCLIAYSSRDCRAVVGRYFTLRHSNYPMIEHACGGHLWSVPLEVFFSAGGAVLLYALTRSVSSARVVSVLLALLVAVLAMLLQAERGRAQTVRPPLTLFSLQSFVNPHDTDDVVVAVKLAYESAPRMLPVDNFERMSSYLAHYAWWLARLPAFLAGMVASGLLRHVGGGRRGVSSATNWRAWHSAAFASAIAVIVLFAVRHPNYVDASTLGPFAWDVAFGLSRPAVGAATAVLAFYVTHEDSSGRGSSLLVPGLDAVRSLLRFVGAWSPVSSFSKIGYSFSLVHPMVLTGYFVAMPPSELFPSDTVSSGAYARHAAAALLACLVASTIFYNIIERPVQMLAHKLSSL